MTHAETTTFLSTLPPGSLCVVVGVLISFIVGTLKKVPFIMANPKLVSLGITVLMAGIASLAGYGGTIGEIAACIAATFGSSVATHEVVTTKAVTALPTVSQMSKQ